MSGVGHRAGTSPTSRLTGWHSRRVAIDVGTPLEETAREFLAGAPSGPVAVADLDGTFVAVSAEFAEVVGEPARRLLGRTLAGLTMPQDFGSGIAELRELFAGRIRRARAPMLLRRGDGGLVPVVVARSLERDRLGRRFVVTELELDVRR